MQCSAVIHLAQGLPTFGIGYQTLKCVDKHTTQHSGRGQHVMQCTGTCCIERTYSYVLTMYTQLCCLFLQTVQQPERIQPGCMHSRDTEQRIMQLRAGSNEAVQNVVMTQLTELAEMHPGGYSQSACEKSTLHYCSRVLRH